MNVQKIRFFFSLSPFLWPCYKDFDNALLQNSFFDNSGGPLLHESSHTLSWIVRTDNFSELQSPKQVRTKISYMTYLNKKSPAGIVHSEMEYFNKLLRE